MIKNYLKVALKVLARRKFFTFISLFGICVTLLVLMVVSAIVDHAFAPHSPETRSDRTLGIYHLSMKGPENNQSSPPGYGFLDRYARRLAAEEAPARRLVDHGHELGVLLGLRGERTALQELEVEDPPELAVRAPEHGFDLLAA